MVKDTIARLDRLIEDANDEAEKSRATRALAHLYKLLQSHEALVGARAMKIRRLRVTDFAAIREADIEFGPGLNVLYGPNDLGKSTLADAIRLALLLPHTSTHIEDYVPWTGGQQSRRRADVRNRSRSASGASGRNSAKAARRCCRNRRTAWTSMTSSARERWTGSCGRSCAGAFPSPEAAGGSKGLPTSFLATVLLSTQSDVTAVLSRELARRSERHGKGTDRGRVAGRGAGSAVRRVAQSHPGATGRGVHGEGREEDRQGKLCSRTPPTG